jgi:iron complex outermembrane receptor protein
LRSKAEYNGRKFEVEKERNAGAFFPSSIGAKLAANEKRSFSGEYTIMKRYFKVTTSLSVSAIAVLASLAAAPAAFAAEPAAAPASQDAGGITVTARKRAESILKVPVTVVALSGEQLEQRGIVSVTDVAASTPGININNSSSGHADRSFQQIIMRGFTPSSTLATTTSMFIDGVAVSSPSELTSVTAPERIEILKGPQSAYFGRATFAGAINVVNKVPTGQWAGSLTGSYGTQDSNRLQGTIEGPIFGDVLTFRVTGDKYKKGGTWTNAYDGSRLGTTSSQTATGLLVFKPAANFKVKLFGLLSEDNDGAPAQARVNFRTVTNAAGQVVQTDQSNCTFNGNSVGVQGKGTTVANPYFCGTLPNFVDATSFNTTNTDAIRSWLAAGSRRVVSPEESVQGYGLKRVTQHAHTSAEWNINSSLTANLLAGYNREVFSTLIDLDGYDTSTFASTTNPKGYFDFPFLIERKNQDWSVEGRLNYDAGPLHILGGVSYLKAFSISGGGGSFGALSSSNFTPGDKSQNKTTGLFGALTYDFTDQLSLSAEGRYQIDTVSIITGANGRVVTQSVYVPAGTYTPGQLIAEQTSKNFAPRVIANYKFTPDLMAYASFSKGVNGALNNANILTASAVAQAAGLAAGGTLLLKPEKVTNYEVGLKGTALDRKLRFTLATYLANWTDQVNALTIAIPDTTATTGFSFANVSTNAGNVKLYGIEGDVAWKINSMISLDAAGAINASSINSFYSTTVSKLTGVFDFSGKEQRQTSKYSANVGINFAGDIGGTKDASWLVRADFNYKSGMYTNEANTTKSAARKVVNLRGSVTKGSVSVDLYVNNLFNDTNPATIADASLFTTNFAYTSIPNSVQIGLPEKRTAGVQVKVKF